MTPKPTAVVVRLPLSGDQKTCFYSRHYTGDPTPGLIAIGTPVASGELEVVGYVSENSICLMTEQAARSIHLLREHERSFDTGLVRQSGAQAALAAAQAEIAEEQRISNLRAEAIERWSNSCAQQDEIIAGLQAENMRLREHLETVRSYLKEAPSVTARRGALDVIEEALKGPAA